MQTNLTSGSVLVTGNTYPVKEQLKAIGARWDGKNKGWRVPAERLDEAQAIVSGAGPSRSFGSRSRRSGGRCEDAPCCGCCGPQGDGDYYGYQGDY